jgi:hypothetical protein
LDRPLKLLIVMAAVAAAPIPAATQTWPASVAAAAPRMAAPPARSLVIVTYDARVLRRPHGVPPTQPTDRAPLRLSSVEPEDAIQVDLRAKDEWTDDQGFRVSPTRVAFKRRF